MSASPPTIVEFDPRVPFPDHKFGLNSTNNSVSPTRMSGTGFEDKMPVSAKKGTISWSGKLNQRQNGTWHVNLTCSNPPGLAGDPEDVTVTVGTGANTGSKTFEDIIVGTP